MKSEVERISGESIVPAASDVEEHVVTGRSGGEGRGELNRDGDRKGGKGDKIRNPGYKHITPQEAIAQRIERERERHEAVRVQEGKEKRIRATITAKGGESVGLRICVMTMGKDLSCDSVQAMPEAPPAKFEARADREPRAGELPSILEFATDHACAEKQGLTGDSTLCRHKEESHKVDEGRIDRREERAPVPIMGIGLVLQSMSALGWSPHEYADTRAGQREVIAARASEVLMECRAEAAGLSHDEHDAYSTDQIRLMYAGLVERTVKMLMSDNGTDVALRKWSAERVAIEWIGRIEKEDIRALREQQVLEALVMFRWKKGDLLCQRGWGRVQRTETLQWRKLICYVLDEERKEVMRKEQPRWKRAGVKTRSREEADVIYLQAYFRSSRRERKGPRGVTQRRWVRGGMRGFRFFWRRTEPACESGARLASDDQLAEVSKRALEVVDWLRTYAEILKRRRNGQITTAHLCSSAGGDSEGVRRMGGTVFGVDIVDQPSYRRRFGKEAFEIMDATDALAVSKLSDKRKVTAFIMGPSCQPFSTLAMSSKVKDILAAVRKAVMTTGKDYILENVLGSRAHLIGHVSRLTGRMFGLKVEKGRFFETSFKFETEAVLLENETDLFGKMCLGDDESRRWPRQDVWGRPSRIKCCGEKANLYAVQGKSPKRGTVEDSARAMGVDATHMSYEELAQSIPPLYSSYMFGEYCKHACNVEYGVPKISFSQMMENPKAAKRALYHFLRGAGEESPHMGIRMVKRDEGMIDAPGGGSSNSLSPWGKLGEEYMRDLHYSSAGDFSVILSRDGEGDGMRAVTRIRLIEPVLSKGAMRNENVLVLLEVEELRTVLPSIVVESEWGRFVVVVDSEAAIARELGEDTRWRRVVVGTECNLSAWVTGVRRTFFTGDFMPFKEMQEYMDPIEVGKEPKLSKEGKEAESYTELYRDWQAVDWTGLGVKESVVKFMTEGVTFEEEVHDYIEFSQYDWPNQAAFIEATMEADRQLTIGAIEYVVEDSYVEMEKKMECGRTHAWHIVKQGAKWRLCLNMKPGTNTLMATIHFQLPSPYTGVRRKFQRFSKWDARDFFFVLLTKESKRHFFWSRHPSTRRLMQARSPPFGWLRSPFFACELSKEMADWCNREAVKEGVAGDYWVFVDDLFLAADEDEESDGEEGNSGNEARAQVIGDRVWDEFKVANGVGKRRGGGCQLLDFLGLFQSSVPGWVGRALPEDKRSKLNQSLDDWLEERRGGHDESAHPVEVASLVGTLIFGYKMVDGGRAHLGGLITQLGGAIKIDWRKGKVLMENRWGQLKLNHEFWDEVVWWKNAIQRSNCRLEKEKREVVGIVSGSDASDWGAGSLAWIDGEREEIQFKFTKSEKKRPINWRELLGRLQILEHWEDRMHEEAVEVVLLCETDNMTSHMNTVKGRGKQKEMRESQLRIEESAARAGLTLVSTHTPGKLLDRPDRTSRGDVVCEPRQRLRAQIFGQIEAEFGPFTEFLGSERRHATMSRNLGEGREQSSVLFLHPTFQTVGSAMRMVIERRTEGDLSMRAIMVVPFDKEAMWSCMLKHFNVVRTLESSAAGHLGDGLIEEITWSGWTPRTTSRNSLLISFPRVVGHDVRPVVMVLDSGEKAPDKYITINPKDAGVEGGIEAHAPISKGSMLYAESTKVGRCGMLVIVVEDYSPEFEGAISCACLKLVLRGGSNEKRSNKFETGSYSMEKKGGKSVPWPCSAEELWDVSSMILSNEQIGREWWEQRVEMDWMAAEAKIASFKSEVLDEEDGDDVHAEIKVFDVDWRKDRTTKGDMSIGITMDNGMESYVDPSGEDGAWRDYERSDVMTDEKSKRVGPSSYSGARCVICKNTICLGSPSVFVASRPAHAACAEATSIEQIGEAFEVIKIKEKGEKVQEVKPASEQMTVMESKRGSLWRDKMGHPRLEATLVCMHQKCGKVGPKVMCVACGKTGIHPACVDISTGHAKLGNYKCTICRLRMVGMSLGKAKKEMVLQFTRTSLLLLTAGASATGANMAEVVRIEREFMMTHFEESEVGSVAMPRHSPEMFAAMLGWIGENKKVADINGFMRNFSGALSKWELEDFTSKGEIKRMVKEVEKMRDHQPMPQTITTMTVYREMFHVVLPTKFHGLLLQRWQAMMVLEAPGGLRVGEVTGEVHGLLANDVQFLRDTETKEVFVDVKVVDSKTGMPRFLSMVGVTTTSRIGVASSLMGYLKAAKVALRSRREGQYDVLTPDYHVLRVSLFSISRRELSAIDSMAGSSKVRDVRDRAAYIVKDATTRAEGKGIEEKKFVNVWGGAREAPEFGTLWNKLKQAGVDPARITKTPGPLIRKTEARGAVLTHMCLDPGGTSKQVGIMLDQAYRSNESKGIIDRDLDLAGRDLPFWRNHANRRLTAFVAMEAFKKGGPSAPNRVDIDLYMGWSLKVHKRSQAIHYSGEGRVDRRRRASISARM